MATLPSAYTAPYKLFAQVDPSDVWLMADIDNRAYFPNESGRFDLSEVFLGTVFSVEGPNASRLSVSSTAQSSGSGASAAYESNPLPPSFRSVIPKAKASVPTTSVKVVKATMETSRSGKIDFTQLAQMHIDVSENNANVHYILSEIEQKWGGGYLLVTLNGLELEDCEGTRGMLFF